MYIPRYKTERRPFNPSQYDSYLETYGSVYGDMSDPVARAEAIKSLHRAHMRRISAALREMRQVIGTLATDYLADEMILKQYQIEECSKVRGWNVRNTNICELRMIVNELRMRGFFDPHPQDKFIVRTDDEIHHEDSAWGPGRNPEWNA